jgi:hypothetical protein
VINDNEVLPYPGMIHCLQRCHAHKRIFPQ